MSIDFSVSYLCSVKNHVGRGDIEVGTGVLREMMMSAARARLIKQTAEEQGNDPYDVKIRVLTRSGVEEATDLAELERRASPLGPLSQECAECSCNPCMRAFGCMGEISFPITLEAETWLLRRLRPHGTLNTHLLFDFLNEFNIDGEPIREMREQGYFEQSVTPAIQLSDSDNPGTLVTSDQILQCMIKVGDELGPDHCFGLLLWFGAVLRDRQPIQSMEDFVHLNGLPDFVERLSQAQLVLGPMEEAQKSGGLSELLMAMFFSWAHQLPLSLEHNYPTAH